VALSAEPPERGVLDQPPRPRSASLLDRATLLRVFGWLGPLEGALALAAFVMAYWSAGWRPGVPLEAQGALYAQATTVTYAAIVMAQAGNAFSCRTRSASLFQVGFFSNRALIVGVAGSIALMLALIYLPPLAAIFGFVPPAPTHWVVLVTYPLVMIVAEEARKWWGRRST
jgi:magnesium-transporting ATPase (P-type)